MAKIAAASRHSLAYVAETEPGTTPENPQMTSLRNVNCSLNLSRDSFTSEELRKDRQISDVRTGTNQIAGDIGIEPSYGEYDAFFEACLGGTWNDDELTAGVEERSFTIERAFNDIEKYTAYRGCFLNTLNLSLQPNSMISATFGVIGLDAQTAEAPLAAEPVPSLTNRPYDTYIGELREGDKVIAVVTGIDLTLDNGIQPQYVLFQRSAPFVSWGKSNVTGTLTAFFENMDLINKFLDETPTSLEFTLGKPQDGSYTFILPSIRYTGADNPVNSDGPISISMPFQAVLDECTGTNIIIRRTPPLAGTEAEPCSLEWSSTALEGDAEGAIGQTIAISLTGGNGKKFAGSNDEALAGVSIDGLPAGLAAKLTRTGDTSAELAFTGKAENPEAASLTVTLAARAFSQGFCHCAGNEVENATQTIALSFGADTSETETEPDQEGSE